MSVSWWIDDVAAWILDPKIISFRFCPSDFVLFFGLCCLLVRDLVSSSIFVVCGFDTIAKRSSESMITKTQQSKRRNCRELNVDFFSRESPIFSLFSSFSSFFSCSIHAKIKTLKTHSYHWTNRHDPITFLINSIPTFLINSITGLPNISLSHSISSSNNELSITSYCLSHFEYRHGCVSACRQLEHCSDL